MNLTRLKEKMAASFYDDPKLAMNDRIATFGSIIRKNGKYYFNSISNGYIELDLNDNESIGALITNSIAKHLLESKNET